MDKVIEEAKRNSKHLDDYWKSVIGALIQHAKEQKLDIKHLEFALNEKGLENKVCLNYTAIQEERIKALEKALGKIKSMEYPPQGWELCDMISDIKDITDEALANLNTERVWSK